MSDTSFHDEDFQKTVLAYIWREKGYFSRYEEALSQSYFDSTLNGNIYGLILSYFQKYRKTPSREVLLELTRAAYSKDTEDDKRKRHGQEVRIDELVDLDISDSKFIDEKVREFIGYKAMYAFVTDAFQGLKGMKYDPELPKKARQALSKGEEVFRLGLEWTGNMFNRVVDQYQLDTKLRVPTGLNLVDEHIRNGGLREGELGILLAPPKGFKSGTLINFAYGGLKYFYQNSPAFEGFDAADQHHIGYITLELSEDLVAGRFDQCCLGWDKDRIMRDPYGAARNLEKMRQFLGGKLFIKNYPSKTASCDTIKEYLDRMWEQYGIKFCALFVDYLDLVKASGGPTRFREDTVAGLICEELRAIAIEYRMPIWSACRATREAVGAPLVSMRHMSRSFERVGIADIVVALCQTDLERKESSMRLVPIASRNDGQDTQINCTVDYKRMRIYCNEAVELELAETRKEGSAASAFASKGMLKGAQKPITGALAD